MLRKIIMGRLAGKRGARIEKAAFLLKAGGMQHMARKRSALNLGDALERASASLSALDDPSAAAAGDKSGGKPAQIPQPKLPPEAARQFKAMKSALLDFERTVKAGKKASADAD